jgi:hypothetical protein
MAQERPSRLAEWIMLLRKNVPLLREHVADWAAEVREEPRLLWETSPIRYATYGVGAILAVWLVTFVVGFLTPPPPVGAKAAATTADYHIICSDPACAYHFVVQYQFGFHDFPIECSKCMKRTGVSARRCNSPTCQGRWVAPIEISEAKKCPICGAMMN